MKSKSNKSPLKIWLSFWFLIFAFSPKGHSGAKTYSNYEDLFQDIVRGYQHLAVDDLVFSRKVREMFWNSGDRNIVFKLASESSIRLIDYPRLSQKYFFIETNYYDWATGKNILRDRCGNKDQFLVMESSGHFMLLGELPFYESCTLRTLSDELVVECARRNEFDMINDKYRISEFGLNLEQSSKVFNPPAGTQGFCKD